MTVKLFNELRRDRGRVTVLEGIVKEGSENLKGFRCQDLGVGRLGYGQSGDGENIATAHLDNPVFRL